MNRTFFQCLLVALLATLTACSRPSSNDSAPAVSDAAVSDPKDTAAADGRNPSPAAELSVDGQPIDTIAKVRRDGNGQIIELDLRQTESAPLSALLAQVDQMPQLRSVLLTDTAVSPSDLKHLQSVPTLENLDLRGCAIGDESIRLLTALPKLIAVKLSGKNGRTQVTNAAMESIGKITSLRVLALDFLPIDDAGLSRLGDLASLSELYLAGTELSDTAGATLAKFSGLTKLRVASTGFGTSGLNQLAASNPPLVELDISDCAAIDDSALEVLGKLKRLQKLNLYSTSVSSGNWNALQSLDQLNWLNVDKTAVNDEALTAIGQLSTLTFLHLGSTQITDAGLGELAPLAKLERLIVTRTAVTEAGVQALQPKLPKAEIQLEYVDGK